MKEELLEIQNDGYAVNNEELQSGYSVLASPIYASDGQTAAALRMTIPAGHYSSRPHSRYITLNLGAAQRASIQLGFNPDSLSRPSQWEIRSRLAKP